MARRLRCLLLTWTMLSGASLPIFAQEAPRQPAAPLTEAERREVLDRLYELRVTKAELSVLNDHLEKRDALDAREKAAWERSIEIEKKATALAERERDLEKARGDFLNEQLKAATKGRSVGCTILKLLPPWIWRCN